MHWLEWLDARTILASEAIIVLVFAAFIIGLRAFHPKLSGITAIAVGFLAAIPGILLLLSQDATTAWLPIAASTVSLFVSAACLNLGVYQFAQNQFLRVTTAPSLKPHTSRPRTFFKLILPVNSVALLALIYFSSFHIQPAACLLAITLPLALTRVAMARNLVLIAKERRHILWFACTTAVFATFTLTRGIRAFLVPLPEGFLSNPSADLPGLLVSLLFLCAQGLFYMLLFATEATQTAHDEAQFDFLTGVLNRRGIERALEAEVARTWRTGGELAILLIDVDHFKSINDGFGHAAGDQALRRVVAAFTRTLRVYDRIGRFGGDEFLILLPQTSQVKAIQTANRILDVMRAESDASGPLTLSIGATCCSHSEPTTDIIARADAALYRAKDSGRNTVFFRAFYPQTDEQPDSKTLPLTGTDGPTRP